MRILLIIAGGIGLVLGFVTLAMTGAGRSPATNEAIMGLAITVVSAVGLAAGLATVDIVRAIREKHT